MLIAMQIKHMLHYSTPAHIHDYIEKNEDLCVCKQRKLESRMYTFLSISLINCVVSILWHIWHWSIMIFNQDTLCIHCHQISFSLIFHSVIVMYIRSGADLRACFLLFFSPFDHKIIRTGCVKSLILSKNLYW